MSRFPFRSPIDRSVSRGSRERARAPQRARARHSTSSSISRRAPRTIGGCSTRSTPSRGPVVIAAGDAVERADAASARISKADYLAGRTGLALGRHVDHGRRRPAHLPGSRWAPTAISSLGSRRRSPPTLGVPPPHEVDAPLSTGRRSATRRLIRTFPAHNLEVVAEAVVRPSGRAARRGFAEPRHVPHPALRGRGRRT